MQGKRLDRVNQLIKEEISILLQRELKDPRLGFVTVEARPGCLFLSAFHTFPEEHTVVKTQSLIEKKAAPRA